MSQPCRRRILVHDSGHGAPNREVAGGAPISARAARRGEGPVQPRGRMADIVAGLEERCGALEERSDFDAEQAAAAATASECDLLRALQMYNLKTEAAIWAGCPTAVFENKLPAAETNIFHVSRRFSL